MYKIKISKKASKFIESRNKSDKERLLKAIIALKEFPFCSELDIKPLKLKKVRNIFRVRIGSYRIIFSVHENISLILISDV